MLQENFGGATQIVPDLEGTLFLKEDGKKVWKPRYFVLRASGIYYVPKGKTKVWQSKESSCVYALMTTMCCCSTRSKWVKVILFKPTVPPHFFIARCHDSESGRLDTGPWLFPLGWYLVLNTKGQTHPLHVVLTHSCTVNGHRLLVKFEL